jgi:hypothetical protein
MKRILGSSSILLLITLFLVLIATPSTRVFAGGGGENDKQINPPPFDFADFFYEENGIDLSVLNSPDSARFGRFRQTGPPAPPGKFNWVIDNSDTSPIRNNVRILATTGAYKDDDGSPNQFFSIIAIAKSDKFFGTIETNNDKFVAAGADNARGITTEEIVGVPNAGCPPGVTCQTKPPLPSCNPGLPFDPESCSSAFEAYAGLKQVVNGVIAPSPCGTMGDGLTPCFPVTSVETSHLRQDWRLTTNRSRNDNSASFAYFGDNVLGMWVITYHWYTKFAVGGRPDQMIPTQTCQKVLAAAARQNGLSLDGTPIIHSGEELHFLEGVASHSEFGLPLSAMPPKDANGNVIAPCAMEMNEDPTGKDGGAVWLVCPAISDPTHGGIAPDAFLDVVRRPDGTPLDPRITKNFECLQKKGQFCQKNHGPDPDGDGDNDGN